MFERNISMKIDESKKNKEKIILKERKTNMILASFMLFVFPIIAVITGVLLGQYIGGFIETSIQISRIFGGIIGFILAIISIKLFDKSAIIDVKDEKIYWEDL